MTCPNYYQWYLDLWDVLLCIWTTCCNPDPVSFLFTRIGFVFYNLCLHYNFEVDRMWYDYNYDLALIAWVWQRRQQFLVSPFFDFYVMLITSGHCIHWEETLRYAWHPVWPAFATVSNLFVLLLSQTRFFEGVSGPSSSVVIPGLDSSTRG